MKTHFPTKKSSTLTCLLIGLSLSACQASDIGQDTNNKRAATTSDTTSQITQPASQKVSRLSEAAKQGLLLMYEEEKLAHDVYITLFDKWQINSFNNIAQTEIRHQGAVEELLKKYNIPYTAAVQPHGSFANADLQKAYDKLTEKGLQSETDALKVGLYVEELDIDDLNRLNTTNLPADIKRTYDWLTMGSRNHLRGFYKGLTQRGVIDYQAQILSQSDFDTIIDGEHERGMGRGHGSKRGGGGHGHGSYGHGGH